jgi:hypothetical protein
MILVFLTLFIALSIVFILSGSCSRFFKKDFFDAASGTLAYAATKSVLRNKTGLQLINLYFDISKSSFPGSAPGLIYCRYRKKFFYIFTSVVSGL